MKNSPKTLADRNRKRAYWKKTIDPNSFPRSILRVCKDCGDLKPCSWNHSFTQTGKPEYKARCDSCYLKYWSNQRRTKRRDYTDRRLACRSRRKEKCIEILGGKCERCGYSKSLKALTFHHRDPSTKKENISKMLERPWNEILIELEKCALLCFNCHMEEEEVKYSSLTRNQRGRKK